MKMNFPIAVSLLMLLIPLFHAYGQGRNTLEIAVYGRVTSQDHKPIAGVTVDIVIPGKGVIDSRDTDFDGRFVFTTSPDEPFDIMMTHDKYALSIVEHLTDREHQQVSQILYPKGKPLPVTAAHHQYQSYERLAVLMASMPSGQPKWQELVADSKKFLSSDVVDGNERTANIVRAKARFVLDLLKSVQ